jgi:hypothetical protein
MKIVNLESIFLVFVGKGSISISVIPKQKALNQLLRMVEATILKSPIHHGNKDAYVGTLFIDGNCNLCHNLCSYLGI